MLWRSVAFAAFAMVFAYFGFFDLANAHVAAFFARLLFALFVALLASQAILGGVRSCEQRALQEERARRIDV